MAKKVFNKKLPQRCEYCLYGNRSQYANEVICKKRGITDVADSCRHYKYDPLKRVPKDNSVQNTFSAEDFSI